MNIPVTPNHGSTILGNDAQIDAEKAALQLLHDSDVRALLAELKTELSTTARAASGDGADRLDNALLQWTTALIIDEANYVRRAHPAFTLGTDTTPRRWFGHTFPGNGKSGDNPDALYRTTVLDGTGTYEVTGKIDTSRPLVQLLFTIAGGTMTHPIKIEAAAGQSNPDAGIMSMLGMLNERQLNISADGTFKLTVGGEPGSGVHLPTKPVPCSFGCRQMVLDWDTKPMELTLTRLDRQEAKPLDMAELKQAVLTDLANVVRFWAGFADVWLGGVARNSVAQPAPREGGWGYIGGLNFSLEPGEAAVVTLHPGDAAYMGFQLTDPWMLAPDNARRQSSLNLRQSTPDADGRYTYVISPVDPGIANWLDTAGLQDGMGFMRWQGFPEVSSDNAGLFHDFRVMPLTELDSLEGVARITPAERAQRLAARTRSYYSRFAAI